jgi:PE family
MSYLTAFPDAIAAAAGTLQGIGSAVSAQNAAAVAPTTGVVPAAADPVSAMTATAFVAHATLHHQVAAQAEAIHELFVSTLGLSSGSYLAAEAANVLTAG